MRKFYFSISTIAFSFFIFGFAGADATVAQRTETEDIELTEGARKDGFEVSEERGKLYVQARNVFDPISKERLEGLKKLRIVCEDSERRELQQIVDALFEAGSTRRLRTRCNTVTEQRIKLIVFVMSKEINP